VQEIHPRERRSVEGGDVLEAQRIRPVRSEHLAAKGVLLDVEERSRDDSELREREHDAEVLISDAREERAETKRPGGHRSPRW